jgi:hypothetical protein
MKDARRNGASGGGAAGPLQHLIEEGGATADTLRAANERAEPLLGEEARAWAALKARQARVRSWAWRSAAVGAGAMAALLVAGWLIWPRHQSVSDRTNIPASAGGTVAAPAPPAPSRRAGAPTRPRTPSPLQAGESALASGVRIRLSADGRGDLLPAGERGGTRIVLEQGTLEVDARQSRPGSEVPGAVLVTAGSFSIEGNDAHLTVTTRRVGAEASITVAVHDGRAGISSPALALIWVYAGDLWISPLRAAKRSSVSKPGRAAAAPAANGSAPDEARDCLRLASAGATDAAVSCLEAARRQSGLAGELALVELARIRRDIKGDIAGAEQALAEHGRRFPQGALIAEVAIARVELLLQLGRASEALAQVDRLPAGEASFWRGVCLARLGRNEEAARALDEYLSHPGGARRAEAMRRRRELGR